MTRWQRRARLVIAIGAVAFAATLPFAVKRRPRESPAAPVARTDPDAIVEGTIGRVTRFKRTREDVTVEFERQLTYQDGSARLVGVRIVTEGRRGDRTFTVSGQEGSLGQNDSTIELRGAVRLTASDGLTAHSDRATYADGDGILRAPGPVEFSRRGLSGSGIGMTYDRHRDVLVVLDQARIRIASNTKAVDADITSGTAEVARRDKTVRLERGLSGLHGSRAIAAETGVAHLNETEDRVTRLELYGNASLTAAAPGPGTLESLSGRQVDLTYGADGESIERAVVTGDALVQLAGDKGAGSRRVSAALLDITLGPDGATPVALVGRDGVQLVFPGERAGSARTIKAARLEARGKPQNGLTTAVFTGDVDFRERDADVSRVGKAGRLEVALRPGMSAIADAVFSRNVRFATESGFLAVAAVARYAIDDGTLALGGSEAAAPRPHLTMDQMTVDATQIDATIAGPRLKARGDVRSVLQPDRSTPSRPHAATKLPSMLKSDRPVNVIGDRLDYDGTASTAAYAGGVKLWQADTSIQADTLVVDSREGDLAASGSVATTTMLRPGSKGKGTNEPSRSIGTAKEFSYEESLRRATYVGDAHLSGPQGDMTATKIELYLQPSGDELDRAEAYEKLTLREQNRKTTGSRLTYTTATETYLVTGEPVLIVDECGRETIGKRLTFVKSTDRVNIDGSGQIRTQTRGGQCP
jgi:LPS export ABC transporter protein LptC